MEKMVSRIGLEGSIRDKFLGSVLGKAEVEISCGRNRFEVALDHLVIPVQ